MTTPTPACAGCGRQVALRGISPQGPLCSACVARRHSGTCGSCSRDGRLVGRNARGQPWCSRCYQAANKARVTAARTAVIVAAVHEAAPALPEATVRQLIVRDVGVRSLGLLARHLTSHPNVLLAGPTSLPPALDRLVRSLVSAGAEHLRVIHPSCLDCGRAQPAQQRLPEGVLCGACYARRASTHRCVDCGRLQRRYSRDKANHAQCQGCVERRRRDTERAELLAQLTATLGPQTLLEDATLITVLSKVAHSRPQLRHLIELLSTGPLTEALTADPWPFALARLVIGLRAAGADLPAPLCRSCQQPIAAQVVLRAQRVLCRGCAWRCPNCAKPRRSNDPRPCERCRSFPGRARGSCATCHKPEQLLDPDRRCRTCRERAARSCADCHQNGARTTVEGQMVCHPCALRRTVDELLPEHPTGQLHGLRPAILAAAPLTTRKWLNRPLIATLLADLDTGRLPLTHATLDAQQASRGVEHLRNLLLGSGSLPADPDRQLRQLEQDSQLMLRSIAIDDARIVRSWLRWQVLPRLRQQLDGPVDSTVAGANAKRTLIQVIAFLTALQASQRTLASCTQADLDSWFSTRKARPHFIRAFLAYAQRTKHLPGSLTLPAVYRSSSQPPADPEQRWAIARRLIHDETLDTADRVAGALVVLYAQPIVRICALSTDQVQTDGTIVTLRLGDAPLELQEPFATLIQLLPLRRRAGVAEQLPGNWLFPGNVAGGHLTAASLRHRLREIGIEPRRMRLAALDQLSREVLPAMLSGILGLNVPGTVRYTSQAGGDWAKYAASRST